MITSLIVNADDYGLTAQVSAGIRHAHLHGIVTSTTVLVNAPGAAEAVQTALRECPQLGLGLHLTLTCGAPLLPPERIPSLAAQTAGGRFPRLANLLAHAETVNPRDVQAEWQAQVDAFIQMSGRAPDHLDCHHHTAYFLPEWAQSMLQLARGCGCGVRNPFNPAEDQPSIFADLPKRLRQRAAQVPALLAAASDVPQPQHFISHFYEGVSEDLLRTLTDHLPTGTSEIMCHPGHVDDALRAVSSYSDPREMELSLLSAPGLRRQLQQAGIRLCSFSALQP